MLPGSGIGPELMEYVKEIFRYAGIPVNFEVINVNESEVGNDDLEYAINSIKRNGYAIKGNIETKSEAAEVISRNVALRNELDLYVNVVNCKTMPGIATRHRQELDIVLIRQNTEGEYAMLEHESVPGVVESMKVMTDENSERVARFAFEYARNNNRKKVTTVHKANIMKLSDGLFLEVSRRVAKEYPEIEHNDIIIDNCCMQMVSRWGELKLKVDSLISIVNFDFHSHWQTRTIRRDGHDQLVRFDCDQRGLWHCWWSWTVVRTELRRPLRRVRARHS